MPNKKYRTHTTGLSDDELLILDVMFNCYVTWPMLRQRHFTDQFNAESHSLDDQTLVETLQRFLREDVIAPIDSTFRGCRYIGLTSAGGELWSRERCPVWDRYCMDCNRGAVAGREMLTIMAVSPDIRDDCLRLLPEYPARRRTAVINDSGLIHWHPFDKIHVGLATYVRRQSWRADEAADFAREHQRYRERLDRERTWWRTVGELQRFVNTE